MKRIGKQFFRVWRKFCKNCGMIWIARLCGILAAAYLLYWVTSLPENEAKASGRPTMAMSVNGQMMPAMDAVRFNHLEAYNQRYPLFPAVLKGTRWITALEDQESCVVSPRKVWTFSEAREAGRICTRETSGAKFVYSCEMTNVFGRKSVQAFNVSFGDHILPDWTLDRPHITLERDGWRKKKISLQMCDNTVN